MSSATGFLLSIGIGLGTALYAGSEWWWQGLIGLIMITLIHIVIKSELYSDSLEQCNAAGVEFSLMKFSLFTDVTAKSNKTVKTHSFKQDKLCRIAKYYRDIESNIRANFKFGGFANCLNQMTVIVKENSLVISSDSTPL